MRSSLPLALLVSVSAAACGSLGKETEWADEVLTGGAGPFRLVSDEETGIPGNPAGRVLTTFDVTGRLALLDGVAVYETAADLTTPPPRDPNLPGWEVDFGQFAPRRIARSTTHVVGDDGAPRFGLDGTEDVLVATEAFEAGGVYEPCLLQLPSGRVRMYYAAAGGIGVAEADSVRGAFTRLQTTPVLADVAGRGIAQHPAAVRLPDGSVHLYVAVDDAIFHARSSDGLAFTVVDGDPSTAAVDPVVLPPPATPTVDAGPPDPDAGVPVVETHVTRPAAVATTSQTGRLSVRLYFEIRRSDDTTQLGVAGSFDGDQFVRSTVVPYGRSNPIRPNVVILENGATLLSFVQARTGGGTIRAASIVSISPSALSLPQPTP